MARDYVRLRSGYSDAAFDHVSVGKSLRKLVDQHPEFDAKSYDTLVGTGLSGAIVLPSLARYLRKKFLIVRKDKDGSHSSNPAEGDLGRSWLFVDDLIASGNTFRRTLQKVGEVVERHNRYRDPRTMFHTECAGVFLYGDPYCNASLSKVQVWQRDRESVERMTDRWERDYASRFAGWDFEQDQRHYVDDGPTDRELDDLEDDEESDALTAWREDLASTVDPLAPCYPDGSPIPMELVA